MRREGLPRALYRLHTRRLASLVTGGKSVASVEEAVRDIPSGAKLLVGGFGLTGVPENLLRAINASSVTGLTVVSSNVGTAEHGLGPLFVSQKIAKVIGSYVGENEVFEKQFLDGKIEVELVPMGTLAERMRAAGAGIPAFYTATGAGTLVERGGMPQRYASDGSRKVEVESVPREARTFNGRRYILEEAIFGDFALVKAWKGDTEGNLVYRMTSRNHNPAIATAGKITIAEVEELVPAGSIDPNDVHTPGIYVDRIVQGTRYDRIIERLTIAGETSKGSGLNEIRERIVRRAALELKDGDYVNLGIGLPTLVSNYVPNGIEIKLQSENGMLGVGPFPERGHEDCDLVNAGKQTVTALPGASYFSADQSFGMIRGGHCDVTILGSMEVASDGDMANYLIPGKLVKGMGGAMDLVSSQAPRSPFVDSLKALSWNSCERHESRVIVTMEHTDRKGNPKVLKACTLPITGLRCVGMVITELAVFEIDTQKGKMVLTETAPGETVESIRKVTEADFEVSPNLREFRTS